VILHPIHPMVVHFPIALLSTSVLTDALAMGRWRHQELRVTSLSMLLIGLAGAIVAVITGSLAEHAAERSGVPEQVLELHEALGFSSLWVFAGLLGLRIAEARGWVRQRPLLSLALGLVAVIVLFAASYYGGSLVYEFGAGMVPHR
jgi:uncharacterized membrane protein